MTKTDAVLIGGYVPHALAAQVQAAAQRRDLDKSKWMREAMRAQLAREGFAA